MKNITINFLVLFILIISLILVGNTALAYPNNTPAFQQEGTKYGRVGNLMQFQVTASDSDNEDLIFYAIDMPLGAYFSKDSRTFSWTPPAAGNYIARFRVYDSYLSYADLRVPIVISNALPVLGTTNNSGTYNGANNTITTFNNTPITNYQLPPIDFIGFDPANHALEGQLYTYTLVARSGNAKMTYRLVETPQGMTINPESGIILWIPNFSQGRTAPYTIIVGAHNGYWEATRTFTVTVQEVNQNIAVPTVVQNIYPKAPTVSVVETEKKVDVESNKEASVLESNNDNNLDFLAALGLVLGGVFFNPWILLLLILILLYLHYRYQKRIKELEQILVLRQNGTKHED